MLNYYFTYYTLQQAEVKYTVSEYNNMVGYDTLNQLLDAIYKGIAPFYSVHVNGNDLDNYITGSTLNNDLNGGAGQDTLDGGAGDDFLWGGTGADRLIGGAGDDSYNIDDAGDVVVETANGGTDFILSRVSYVLPENVEKLGLGGSGRTVFESYESINGTGNALDNELSGNAGDNHLMGLGGDDTLHDLAGSDTLEGGTGDDKYYVESINSTVIEAINGGRDTAFVMYNVADLASFDFGKFKNVEVIHFANFSSSGQYGILEDGEFYLVDDKLNPKKAVNLDDFETKSDTIGLSKAIFSKIGKKGGLKKDAFWTGSKAHDKNDRIIYDKKAGDLYYDADGSGSRKAVKFADLDKNLKITAKDFFII
ncbi:Ca2+-binding RTX toxin-like protein [Microvirga flocculans]|uniref:Ca2+-binding RTX toxin-like protein n=1 Tax=Microvirga flocculans TaxID=217168 RepID=A0A7W6IDM8_9HYPH|nr:calcium-binding protein [Microvirga flocculans]MBB4038950.1 Ca2+-binding RTX toxin-like protein [Microvirga flocculans]